MTTTSDIERIFPTLRQEGGDHLQLNIKYNLTHL
jgi:hypothetical protein